jgi:6-phosphogluconolactonase
MTEGPEIIILSDPAALALEAARRFVSIAAEAVARQGRFNVALAGGSTPVGLYRLLANRPFREQVDWPNALLYLGDERCVPPDDPRSNHRMIRETLLEGIGHRATPTVRIPPPGLPPPEAAAAYAVLLRRDFRLRGSARPRFDLVLLGVGNDGHTASLFPGMPALDERRRLAVATDVPETVRPAVPRITLTLPVLNAAARVMFLVSGASKAPAVAAILNGPHDPHGETGRPGLAAERAGGAGEPNDPLPARRVQVRQGQLTWLLDTAAAALLR